MQAASPTPERAGSDCCSRRAPRRWRCCWPAPVLRGDSDRIAALKKERRDLTSDYEREKLDERVAKLSGGVAVIKVGAATETELKERKLRVEDALHATRAAVEEGIVPGGGGAMLRARKALEGITLPTLDEDSGLKIVARAFEEPLRRIVMNAAQEPSAQLCTARPACAG